MRGSILLAAGVLATLSAPAARAGSYSISTGWDFASDGSDDIDYEFIPAFDPTLGSLQSISYQLSGTITPFVYAIECFAPGCYDQYPSTILGSVQGWISLEPSSASLSFDENVILSLFEGAYVDGPISFDSSGNISLSEYEAVVINDGLLTGPDNAPGGFELSGLGDLFADSPYALFGYPSPPTELFAIGTVTYTYAAPEPTALAVLSVGLLGLVLVRRKPNLPERFCRA